MALTSSTWVARIDSRDHHVLECVSDRASGVGVRRARQSRGGPDRKSHLNTPTNHRNKACVGGGLGREAECGVNRDDESWWVGVGGGVPWGGGR